MGKGVIMEPMKLETLQERAHIVILANPGITPDQRIKLLDIAFDKYRNSSATNPPADLQAICDRLADDWNYPVDYPQRVKLLEGLRRAFELGQGAKSATTPARCPDCDGTKEHSQLIPTPSGYEDSCHNSFHESATNVRWTEICANCASARVYHFGEDAMWYPLKATRWKVRPDWQLNQYREGRGDIGPNPPDDDGNCAATNVRELATQAIDGLKEKLRTAKGPVVLSWGYAQEIIDRVAALIEASSLGKVTAEMVSLLQDIKNRYGSGLCNCHDVTTDNPTCLSTRVSTAIESLAAQSSSLVTKEKS